MPAKDVWRYHEAQKNALERLQKEWEPPAVPCATPMTSFLNKRVHIPLSNGHRIDCNPKHLKMARIPQQRLCASYNLQLNDLHVLMPRNLYHCGVQKTKAGQMIWYNTLCSSYPVRNIWGKRDHVRNPKVHGVLLNYEDYGRNSKVHEVLLNYGGPEAHTEEPSPFLKKICSQKINPNHEVNVRKFDNGQKTFYIQMPQNKLRVGNLNPRRYHMQQKKKVPFLF